MKLSALEKRLTNLFEPAVSECGFRLVRVKMVGEEHGQILEVLVENPETANLNIDECSTVSREISALLDVEDPIKAAYRLEVSSPGIGRPLMNREDFEKYNELEAKVEIDPPLEGQKRFRGYLKGINENEEIEINTDQGLYYLPFKSVVKAKLVLTEELIRKSKKTVKTEKSVDETVK